MAQGKDFSQTGHYRQLERGYPQGPNIPDGNQTKISVSLKEDGWEGQNRLTMKVNPE